MSVREWFAGTMAKIRYATSVLVAPIDNLPEVQLSNGMSLNIHRNVITIYGDVNIHSTGSMNLSADGDLTLRSGKRMGKETGDLHLNSSLNEHGVPVIEHHNIADDGYAATDHEHSPDCGCEEKQ